MNDRAFANEIRKRILILEKRHKAISEQLEAARNFLAMVERGFADAISPSARRPHADRVGDIVASILSEHPNMHRGTILEKALSKGIHIGHGDDPQRQLAALSSILSRDVRFEPTKGMAGYWSMVTPTGNESTLLEKGVFAPRETPHTVGLTPSQEEKDEHSSHRLWKLT